MKESLDPTRAARYWQHLGDYRFLPVILVLSFVLNVWGNRWGAPNFWHPDEVTRRSIRMVEERTLNPNFFAYGGLHYYTVAAGSFIPVKLYESIFDPHPGKDDERAYEQWYDRHLARIIQMARTISGVMSTTVVLFTFLIGKALVGESVGYLAALFLGVSMSFVGIAHFATVDSAANFWYWLSCLLAVLIWKRGGMVWYVLAAVTAGFAIGTKIDRVVILFPLVLSHFLGGERRDHRKLLLLASIVACSFVASNPLLISSPFEFVDGLTRDLYFNLLRGIPGGTSYAEMLSFTRVGLGFPLFAVSMAGTTYGIYDCARGRNRTTLVWIFATVIPYYLLVGSRPNDTIAPLWYVPIGFPGLMIAAAYGCRRAVSCTPKPFRFAVIAGIGGIVAYSVMNCAGLILQLSNDSRYAAAKWIKERVPRNSAIEVVERGPAISRLDYRVITTRPDREFHGQFVEWRKDLMGNDSYQRIHHGILLLEDWAGRTFGFSVRKEPYKAWFDYVAESYENHNGELSGVRGGEDRESDYVVVVEYLQRGTLAKLQLDDSHYRLAGMFYFIDGLGIQASFPFVNPHVYIFQRDDGFKSVVRLCGDTRCR